MFILIKHDESMQNLKMILLPRGSDKKDFKSFFNFKTFTVILILIFNDRGKGRHKSSLGKLEPAKITEGFFFKYLRKIVFETI